MTYPLNAIHIHHFRSIRDCSLTDLRQINVLIGRPDAGKSNILDAVKLFALPQLTRQDDVDLKQVLRAQTPRELFLMKDSVIQYASVSTNRAECLLQYSQPEGLTAQVAFDTAPCEFLYTFDDSFEPLLPPLAEVSAVIQPYQFREHSAYTETGGNDLKIPYGQNLFSLLHERSALQKPISKIFDGTGITVHFNENGPVIRIPASDKSSATELSFESMSASIQRLCFYLSAIQSNQEKLLVFDNLDSSIFPAMLAPLAVQMLDNPSNQYLFSTHAYYMLIDLLEDGFDDVAVFNVYKENNETKIYRLTDDDLAAIVYNGADPFINNQTFTPNA